MNKVKKILMMVLSLVLVAALSIGGTVAYLQDTDEDVNVMTLGSVKIAQHEYQRAEGVPYDAGDFGKGNGVQEGALVPFVQGQAIYPAVPSDATAYTAEQDVNNLFFWGDYVYSGSAGNGLWNDSKLSNVMDKMVFVENTGKSDAYFRTLIAFECPEGMEYSQGSDKEFMMNTNVGLDYGWDNAGYIEINGTRYYVLVATYQNALKPGNQSHPSLLQVVMTHNATNEDMEKLGDIYEILVLSQAVQTAGFDKAETALDTAFGDVNATNVAEWFGGDEFEVPVVVSDDDELKAAFDAGKKDIFVMGDVSYADDISNDANITLNGNTFEATYSYKLKDNADLTMTGGNYEVNGTYGHVDVRPSTAEGSTVVFEDVNFSYNKKGPSYGPSTNRLGSVVEVCATVADAKTEIVFKNCTFDNAQVLFEGMSGKTGEFVATFENCTFNALTSSAPIYVQNYVKGTLNVIGCTFNLECTSSTASAISVSSSSSTTVTVNAENNTINAVVATPTDSSVTGVDVVKVNGTPANIKFISAYANTTVNETNTTKSGIANF